MWYIMTWASLTFHAVLIVSFYLVMQWNWSIQSRDYHSYFEENIINYVVARLSL
jgi:hypothetical protein